MDGTAAVVLEPDDLTSLDRADRSFDVRDSSFEVALGPIPILSRRCSVGVKSLSFDLNRQRDVVEEREDVGRLFVLSALQMQW